MDQIEDDDNCPRRPVEDWDYKRKRGNASGSLNVQTEPMYTNDYENSDAKDWKNGTLSPEAIDKILKWRGIHGSVPLEVQTKDSRKRKCPKKFKASSKIAHTKAKASLLTGKLDDVFSQDKGFSSDYSIGIKLEKAEDILTLHIDEDTSWLHGPIPAFNKSLNEKKEE